MARRLAQFVVAAVLIIAVGGHWAVLQSVAWVSMAVNYSKDAPLAIALKKTFDGEHPCKLCKALEEGKKSERQHEAKKIETKLDFFCLKELLALLAPLPFSVSVSDPGHVPFRPQTPPSPPPRLA